MTRGLPADRAGSTLMIVIVLMGLLAILGVLFYTFAAQERSNAEYYSDGAKNVEDPGLSADVLMDFALQQLVVSTDPRLKNSALWGSRHSMLANMLGVKNHAISDLTAFDGQGVVIGVNASGVPIVDYDRNGVADSGTLLDPDNPSQSVQTSSSGSNVQDLIGMNDSPAANGLFERNTGKFPQPDVGYTYPDINNAFLAYNGWVRDRSDGTVRRVIIPSFHRPQLYRDVNGPIPLFEDRNYNGSLDSGEDINSNSTLDYGTTAGNRLFRPYPGHLFVPPGQQSSSTVSRFIYLASEAQNLLGDGKRVFPFLPMYPGYNPSSGGTTVTLNNPGQWTGHQGVWSGPHPSDSSYMNPSLTPSYTGSPSGITLHDDMQLDVDNDGDGIRDGVWIDLDFPVQELADGTLYVPLFSFTVYDLDALFNLNAHGNIQNLLFNYPGAMVFNNQSNPFGWNANLNSGAGGMDFIAASNTGMMPSEVNPAWGLTARRGANLEGDPSLLSQYQTYFGNKPFDAQTNLSPAQQQTLLAYQEPANMELSNLLMGRAELNSSGSIDDLHPGLYGEEGNIVRNLGGQNNQSNNPATRDPRYYPHPGQSLNDDNNDLNDNMTTAPQSLTVGGSRVWLDVEQPYDALGMGSYLAGTNGTNPKSLNRVNPGNASSRVRWLRYTNYASNGNVFWGQASVQTGGLMQSNQAYGLFDDPSEVALWPTDKRDVDDPFPADEAAWLHLSNTDINNLGLTSRLAELAGFNFSSQTSDNQRGEEIRKRFTTVANDRKNFAAPRAPYRDSSGTFLGGRYWEWTDDSGFTFDTAAAGSKLRFPPTFGAPGAAIKRYSTQFGPTTGQDPFRPATRYLLQATRDDTQARQFQQRLAVNQLLHFDTQSNQLFYRDLTPHPLDPGAAAIPTAATLNVTATSVRPNLAQLSAAQQEFWARRDRQQLARDIYVLLYLFGAPGNSSNPHYTATDNPLVTAGTTLYTDQQLEQMARFAVNLVDAQDRDNVITRFEYDKDLSNGWDLDDDPYDVSDSGPNAVSDRAEVWGVERQELVFSEALVFRTTSTSSDSSNTAHHDNEERQFMILELRNVAPYDMKFTDYEAWQIILRQLEPGDTAYSPATHPLKERRLTLKSGAGLVTAGSFYTIFSTDAQYVNDQNPNTNPSAFRVDPMGTSSPIWIAPRDDASFAGPASATGNHIDLVAEASGSGAPFRLTDAQSPLTDLAGTPGKMLTDTTPGTFVLNNTNDVRFVLRRRAHPTRSRPTTTAEEADNPWVEVDRIVQSGPMPVFDLNGGATASNIQMQLDSIVSRERPEPIGDITLANDKSDTSYRYNTFAASTNGENSVSTPTQFRNWQPHFDREFTSLGDLLNVPLIGPAPYDSSDTDTDPNPWDSTMSSPVRGDNYPAYARMMFQPPVNQVLLPVGSYFQNYPKSAVAMFTMPDHPTQGTVGTVDADYDNRWYRALEFLEVPTRQHKNLGMGSTFNIGRVAGKINLNTLRYSEVLGGLIDDENSVEVNLNHNAISGANIRLANFPNLRTNTTNVSGDVSATGYGAGSGRDWFEELQNSRDPQDPNWLTITNPNSGSPCDLRLPGLALNTAGSGALNGYPFRSFSYVDETGSASEVNRIINHTLLRQLPIDATQSGSHRRLFEVGNYTDHQGATPLDPVLKYRLLSKMWNNTTVRSNTYVVFVSAKLFRAAIDTANGGAIRIGGPVREYDTPYKDQAQDKNPEQPEYRGVFIVDRSKLEDGLASGGGNSITSFHPFVAYRKILEE
uniref:Uncharacterized protein n=1 Tax=Schlesneria paludicola TaxID=360056 RepID=A0A7C2PA23_9PLAN